MIPRSSHYQACPSGEERARALAVAERIIASQPRLGPGREFSHLVPRELGDGPSLHLDDFSAISLPEAYGAIEFLQHRARLRATDGDYLVTTIPPIEGYEDYCRERLDLGAVEWLSATPQSSPRHLAATCWADRQARQALLEAPFRYLHPHMGSFAVWALADLLNGASKRPLSVIAPPPSLTRAVNNKLWFATTITDLFGASHVPKTYSVSNYVSMAHAVRGLAEDSSLLVVKLTDSVGGGGNLVLEAGRFHGQPLGEIRLALKQLLGPLEWKEDCAVLVGCWETEVLSAPSAQMWIPPLDAAEPQFEGLFEQVIEGREGFFVGNRPARLPRDLTQRIVDLGWLVSLTLQRLGYVGRCSFDLILVGRDLGRCRIEFVECNGRWGGTSLPMTLLTRIFGDWYGRAFACLECEVPKRGRHGWLGFPELLATLGDRLYDARSGNGELILYNPGSIASGTIDVIGLGEPYCNDPRAIRLVPTELQPVPEPGSSQTVAAQAASS